MKVKKLFCPGQSILNTNRDIFLSLFAYIYVAISFLDSDFQGNIYSLINMMKKVQLFCHSQPALRM